jgi:hypothetical protein
LQRCNLEKDAYLELLKSKKQEILNLVAGISEVEFSERSNEKLVNFKLMVEDIYRVLLKNRPVSLPVSLRDQVEVIISYLKLQIANKCDSLKRYIRYGNRLSFERVKEQLGRNEKELNSMYAQIA